MSRRRTNVRVEVTRDGDKLHFVGRYLGRRGKRTLSRRTFSLKGLREDSEPAEQWVATLHRRIPLSTEVKE